MKNTIKDQLEIMNQQIKEVTSIYHAAAARLGISDGEFWVLYALLVPGGEYSQQDICDMWSLPKQTVNSVVLGMKKKGYIYLEAVPGTRNRKIIRLSDSGKEYGENIIFKIYNAEQKTIAKMTAAERRTCIDLMGKYINFLKVELDEE